MKTKNKEPTKDQEVDFYYAMIVFLECGVDIDEDEYDSFLKRPYMVSEWIDQHSDKYPRETSPEVYEYYVSDFGLAVIRDHQGLTSIGINVEKFNRTPRKIKITICED